MATSQSHGKIFEATVISALARAKRLESFPAQKADDLFDVPLKVISRKCAGSIKVEEKKGGRMAVELADATRVWSWPSTLKLQTSLSTDGTRSTRRCPHVKFIIGLWVQVDAEWKEISTVKEITLRLDRHTCRALYNELSVEEVSAYHLGLRAEFHPTYESVKAWSDQVKKLFAPKLGCIRLNPKYQRSTNAQRRLQCEISVEDLERLAVRVREYTSNFYGVSLPIRIASPSRQFNSRPRGRSG